MVDFCLTCSVANFESFGRECKSGVRIQDGCDLQSLPILPKQECILGHWTLVFVPSFESCEREGKYSGLVVQPAEPAKAGVYFGILVFVANFWEL